MNYHRGTSCPSQHEIARLTGGWFSNAVIILFRSINSRRTGWMRHINCLTNKIQHINWNHRSYFNHWIKYRNSWHDRQNAPFQKHRRRLPGGIRPGNAPEQKGTRHCYPRPRNMSGPNRIPKGGMMTASHGHNEKGGAKNPGEVQVR